MDINNLPFANIDNTELISLLNTDIHNHFPLNVLDTMIYDPFQYISNDLATDNLNIDNYFNPTCNYLFSDSANGNNNVKSNPQHLNVLAYNISSIPCHLDNFIDQCINANNECYDVFGFCETRLTDYICNIYNIEGYQSYFNNMI